MKILDQLSLRLREPRQAPEKIDPPRHGVGNSIMETIQRALSSAGLNAGSGPLSGVTHTIEKALSAAGLSRSEKVPGPDGPVMQTPASTGRMQQGEFISRSFTNGAGTRKYKLYVPRSYSTHSSDEVPMVVMLHGCKQSPDDFAAGTQMNALAEAHGFVVAYPAQAANANGSKCWNWFRSQDQKREGGEPSIIAGITREVAGRYRIDRRRVYVAGLSAGAAMAVVLGATYPELYAAVGAHSGLAYAAAHDVPSAFNAMKGSTAPAGVSAQFMRSSRQRPAATHSVPTIVFHGDSDSTVAASNGEAIVEAMVGLAEQEALRVTTHEGATPGGRTYKRVVYADIDENALVEHWVLHGAGHAWSGGSRSGSFTDPAGPDASAEMVRFFLAQKQAGTA